MLSRIAVKLLAAGAIASSIAPTGVCAKDGKPRDLNAYSLRFWPKDTLRAGQTVSQSTSYGTLTCTSTGKVARHCTLR
jgi:hypothetical protein